MILMDLSHDFGENEVPFVKIGARVQESWLVCLLGAIGPNVVSRAPGPKINNFFATS